MSEAATGPSLTDRIRARLRADGVSDAALDVTLRDVLEHFDCPVGSLHQLDPGTGMLRLRSRQGIPEALLPRIETIAVGKGMAGLAAARREPVQVCNLQTDCSGVANPMAKQTSMEGSVAVPMLVGGDVRGVLGVAKPVSYQFSPEELTLLLEVARTIGEAFPPP